MMKSTLQFFGTLVFCFLLVHTSWSQDCFEENAENVVPTNADYATTVFAVDIDGDGDSDIIRGNWIDPTGGNQNGDITWLENDGQGNFGNEKTISELDVPFVVISIDIDSDGDDDIISSFLYVNKILWYENDGQGNFNNRYVDTLNVNTQGSTGDIYSTDLDEDGDNDILAVANKKLVWYNNDGQGNFSSQQVIFESDEVQVQYVHSSDIDNDGYPDALMGTSNHQILWFSNDGQGNFSSANTITTNALGVKQIFAIDLNGDGYNDVIAALKNINQIAWYKNNGYGEFTRDTIALDAEEAWAVYSVDLDSDGDNDVVSGSRNDQKLAWYENDGNGNFIQNIITLNGGRIIDITCADIDGDNDLDITSASLSLGGNAVKWYENLCSITNIDEVSILDSIKLFPNPTNSNLQIDFNNEINEIEYSIYDTLGKQIKAAETTVGTELTIDVSDLNSGIYYISFNIEGATTAKRFIVSQ